MAWVMPRILYELRVREKVGPYKWIKKSRFYEAASPGEARGKYKGSGHIMWIEKASREKILGIGEFFKLGDTLLREFKQETNLALAQKEKEKEQVRKKRGFYDSRRKREEATY